MSAPLLFDRAHYAQRLRRAAKTYPAVDFLRRQVADDIAQRLAMINRRFDVALDLGARTGVLQQVVRQTPDAADRIGTWIEADLCPAMLTGRDGLRLAMDEALPALADQSVDLIVAVLSLHTVNDLPGCLARLRAMLRPDGLFLGVVYGADTLTELRQSLMQAELDTGSGAAMRIDPVIDVRDAGGLLQGAGFALPTVDSFTHMVRYGTVWDILGDIRKMGEAQPLIPPPPPLSRRALAQMQQHYYEHFSDPDGRLRATVRCVTLTGWAPHVSQQTPLRPGSGRVSLAEALNGRSDGSD